MCNIVRYWYTCNHSLRLRRSQCGGTKHKRSKSGSAPACKPESYLSIYVPIDCGPCQHLAFEENWKRKLSRAELFTAELKERGFSGEQELAALVEQLKDEFNAATWDTRSLFPHVNKDRAVRTNLGHFVRRPSPLCHEVFHEDIHLPSDNIDPNNPDCEYDWDYVASTDPIHPVDINYTHPLDDVDPSWMLNHLSPEEFQQPSIGVGFDPREADTLWSSDAKQLYSGPTYWGESSRSWSPGPVVDAELQAQESRQRHGMLNEQTLASTPIDTSIRHDDWRAGRTNMVTGEFWRFVNDNDHKHLQHHDSFVQNAELPISLNDLHNSGPSSSHSNPHVALPILHQTPPQSSPYIPFITQYSTASSSDRHIPPPPATTAPSDHYTAAFSQSSSNSTCTPYNKLRQHLSKSKRVDRERFYKFWLELSRCEIRDAEGVHGRFVQEPPVLLGHDVRNGGGGEEVKVIKRLSSLGLTGEELEDDSMTASGRQGKCFQNVVQEVFVTRRNENTINA